MLSSSLCLYSNNFWETFCLTALETQAAGVPMITTAEIGALSTTLSNTGNIFAGYNPYSPEYKEKFISETIEFNEKFQKKEMNYPKNVFLILKSNLIGMELLNNGKILFIIYKI